MEELRGPMIAAMRDGNVLVINVGGLDTNFTEWSSPDIFPTDLIFNRKVWMDNYGARPYMKYLKEHENVGPLGINKGCFFCHDDFTIAIVTTSESTADILNLVQRLPHHADWDKFVLTPAPMFPE